MDDIDKLILKELMTDGRLSARKLSHKIGLSTVAILSRLKKLTGSDIITGYTVLIDSEKMGYELPAIFEVVVKKDQGMRVSKQFAQMENVCAVYTHTGSTDIMVIVKFKDRHELADFAHSSAMIDGVDNVSTNVVLRTIKEDFRLL